MEGDRALRKRTPVNYAQNTPPKWQTPAKERAKERARNRLAKRSEASGDKENGLQFSEKPATVAAEPQETGPQYKKKRKPAKKPPVEPLKEIPAGSVAEQVEVSTQAGAKVQKGKNGKRAVAADQAGSGLSADMGGSKAETAKMVEETKLEASAKEEDKIGQPGGKKGIGAVKKMAALALDIKKVSKQVAAAAAAVKKATGDKKALGNKKAKQTSTGTTKAAKAGGSKGNQRTPAGDAEGVEVAVKSQAKDSTETAGTGTLPAKALSVKARVSAKVANGTTSKEAENKSAANTRGRVRKGAEGGVPDASGDSLLERASRGKSRKRKAQDAALEAKPEPEPAKASKMNSRRSRKGKAQVLTDDSADGGSSKPAEGPKKAAKGGRKRKAETVAVVEVDGGEEAGKEGPPQKKATGPSAALVPYIDASKAAAERQRGMQGRDKARANQTAAFHKLEEAYGLLRTKYEALKSSKLQETEALFEEQKVAVKTHGEAAMKLVTHWKGEAARLQEERAAIVEIKQRERDVAQENALLNIKFVEQEEQRVIVEARLQELEAELHDVSERARAAAQPPAETRAAAVQVPSPDVRAKWAADASVQVQTDELLPTPAASSVPTAHQGLGEGLEDGIGEDVDGGLTAGLGQGLEEDLGSDPDADNAWRELLQFLTGCCADECGGNKIKFTHEKSDLIFYLTGTPQDDEVTGDVTRDVDTLSRASSFFDADSAGNVSFLYEPESFGLLDDDVSADSELRRPKTLSMRELPRLMVEIMAQTTRVA